MVVTVGLARGRRPIGGAVIADRMAHVEQLTPLIGRVCSEAGVRVAELDRIVVGLGPGPFTGLRVGVVTARILADVIGAELHGICSLDAIAAQYAPSRHPESTSLGFVASARDISHADPTNPSEDGRGGEFVVASDARRREVYWARYRDDGHRLDGPYVSRPADVPRLPTVGPATELYPDALRGRAGSALPRSGCVRRRGPGLPSAGSQPLYLRRPDAAEPGRRKSVLHPTGRRVRSCVIRA